MCLRVQYHADSSSSISAVLLPPRAHLRESYVIGLVNGQEKLTITESTTQILLLLLRLGHWAMSAAFQSLIALDATAARTESMSG